MRTVCTTEQAGAIRHESRAVHTDLSGGLRVGQGQAHHLPPRLCQLRGHRTGNAHQLIALEDLLHLRGDLLVPVAGQVREQVVLDLEAEVASQQGRGPPSTAPNICRRYH